MREAAIRTSTSMLIRATLEEMIERLIELLDDQTADPDIEADADTDDGDDEREQDILDEPHDGDELEDDGFQETVSFGTGHDGSGHDIAEALLHGINRRYRPSEPTLRVVGRAS